MARQRFLDVVLRASNRQLKSDLRASKRELRAFADRSRDMLRSGFAAGIGGFAGFASAQGVMSFGKTVLDNEEALTRLGIQANMSAEELAKVRDVAMQTGREFGVGTAKVLEAGNAIINLEGAAGFSAEKMRVLAQASVATGSSMADLAGVGFALKNAFKIESAEDLAKALSAVTEAGKQGSIPLNEMSTVLQQISVNFSKVGAAGVDGAADLAAAMQLARNSFGSAGETGTGLKAFIGQLEQNSDKFRAFGVRVTQIGKDGKERLRPIREILDEIADSRIMKRNRFKTMLFGSAEARQFLEALLANRDGFEQLSDAARNSVAVQADSQKFLSSTAGRLKIAIANARGELEALFTPERLEKFVNLVEGGLVPALDFVLEHAKTIGMLIIGWKIAEASRSVLGFAAALGKGVGQAGGLMAVMGKIGVSGGGILRSVLGFAGPIGLAATAAWGLFEAFSGSLEKNERITEEQLRQAELSGKVAGQISQFDPRGIARNKRLYAKQLREDAAKSNALLFSKDFGERVSGIVAQSMRSSARTGQAGPLSVSEARELKGLREEFVNSRGVLSDEKQARLGKLLDQAGMLKNFAGGAASLQAESRAMREEVEAAAIEASAFAAFGQKNFSPVGLDLRQLATEKGITDEGQFRIFADKALAELGATQQDLGPRLALGENGVSLRNDSLAVDDQGRVIRQQGRGDSPLARLFQLGDVASAVARGAGDAKFIEALGAKLDEVNANLQAMADRPITIQMDGEAVGKGVSNSPGQRRSPR